MKQQVKITPKSKQPKSKVAHRYTLKNKYAYPAKIPNIKPAVMITAGLILK